MVKIDSIKMRLDTAGNAVCFVKRCPKLTCVKCARYVHTMCCNGIMNYSTQLHLVGHFIRIVL
jgi:hypothetical protein